MTFKPTASNVSVTEKIFLKNYVIGTISTEQCFLEVQNCEETASARNGTNGNTFDIFGGGGEGDEEKIPCGVWEGDGAEEQPEKIIFGSTYTSCSVLIHTCQLGNSSECKRSDFKGDF